MIRSHHSLLLLAPILLTTLSGCGVWDAWRCRWGSHETSCVACNDGTSYPSAGIQPGHSTDQPGETPNPGAPTEAAPTERPALPDPQPTIIEQDVRLQHAPDGEARSESRLIKTLKSPRMFTPQSVRSIYDRFRGSEPEETVPEKPTGPIAQNHIRESPAKACLCTAETDADGGPVQLGLPEPDTFPEFPEEYDRVLMHKLSEAQEAAPPSVMQASPSSFRHPLLADPTGVPYRTR